MTTSHIALLRGINVSGHKKIPMAQLRSALTQSDLQSVKTVLASGNIAFKCESQSPSELETLIQDVIQRQFGHQVSTIVLSRETLQSLLAELPAEPSDKNTPFKSYLSIFAESVDGLPNLDSNEDVSVRLIGKDRRALWAQVAVRKGGETLRFMEILEKAYGKGLTTRTVATLRKLDKLFEP